MSQLKGLGPTATHSKRSQNSKVKREISGISNNQQPLLLPRVTCVAPRLRRDCRRAHRLSPHELCARLVQHLAVGDKEERWCQSKVRKRRRRWSAAVGMYLMKG